MKSSHFLGLVLAFATSHCSPPPVVTDDSAVRDSATSDGAQDAQVALDAASGDVAVVDLDGASTMDSAVGAEAGATDVVNSEQPPPADSATRDVVNERACDPAAFETMMPSGQCDGRGMQACTAWAMQNAGGNPNANAVCISGATSGCARADRCENPMNPSSCRCGSGPACVRGEVCFATGPTAACRPIVCR
ncbi:MAG: hypothetical protein Q8Q09_01580 [Deltaproteobacteria bacterium]|nr:hypothetical protein [Deltaproteobacteria bacterium]